MSVSDEWPEFVTPQWLLCHHGLPPNVRCEICGPGEGCGAKAHQAGPKIERNTGVRPVWADSMLQQARCPECGHIQGEWLKPHREGCKIGENWMWGMQATQNGPASYDPAQLCNARFPAPPQRYPQEIEEPRVRSWWERIRKRIRELVG